MAATASKASKASKASRGMGSPATVAAAVEFILEGLLVNKRVNKDEVSGQARYRR